MQTATVQTISKQNKQTEVKANNVPLMSKSGLFLMSDLDKAKKALERKAKMNMPTYAAIKQAQAYQNALAT